MRAFNLLSMKKKNFVKNQIHGVEIESKKKKIQKENQIVYPCQANPKFEAYEFEYNTFLSNSISKSIIYTYSINFL